VAGGIGRLEIKATTGCRIPLKADKWRKLAASGWRNWSFRNQGSQWLPNSAEGSLMEETCSQWLTKLVV